MKEALPISTISIQARIRDNERLLIRIIPVPSLSHPLPPATLQLVSSRVSGTALEKGLTRWMLALAKAKVLQVE